MVELTPWSIEAPELARKVPLMPAKVEVPVTVTEPAWTEAAFTKPEALTLVEDTPWSIEAPELLKKVAATPAKVLVPVIVELAAERPEVRIAWPPMVALPVRPR